MALQVDQAGGSGLGAELFVGVGVGAGKGDVHGAAVAGLDGVLIEVLAVEVVIQHLGLRNDYIVDYKGVKCHAIFNWFVCAYFVDDVYGIVGESK